MIGTLGPGRVWGGGSGPPPGPPDVTLVAANTVVEDGNRQSNVATGGTTNAGETYFYRLTNTGHDSCFVTNIGPDLGTVTTIAVGVVNWAAAIDAVQGQTCPTAGAPVMEGYATIPGQSGAGHFAFEFDANYCNACGPIAADESYTLELWGPL